MNTKNKNFLLNNILSTIILLEGRKEDVMAKYPDVPKEFIEHFSQNDPSGNNKYLDWMARAFVENGSVTRIVEAVQGYHRKLAMVNPNNMAEFNENYAEDVVDIEKIIKNPKDINSFDLSSLEVLVQFLNSLTSKKQEAQQMKKESDRIYEDKELVVVSPKTHKASCAYGIHSSWCVATANTGHFANYTKNGTLYFFISKIDKPYNQYWSDKDNGKPPYKTALLLKDDGDASWWSKGDSNYTNGLDVNNPKLPMLTQEIVSKVLAHNKQAIETRKQREIEAVLVSKGFYKRSGGDSNLKQNFDAFVRSEIYTPEQLVSIIRNDNWLTLYENSDTGKKLREFLGPKVVFSLIRELLTGQTSMSQVEVLKDMHAQEFLSTYGKELSDDQNREIAQIIVSKLGKKPTSTDVGGDVKMYVDKWTMSPEDWEKYENSSNYFFIGKVEPVEVGDGQFKKIMNLEQITKVDRFNPKDHHVLQMMMLSARFQKLNLYAVVTRKDLLDNYIGVPSQDIPENIMNTVMEKAKKIG
jgi:hypothetical protein